MQGRYVQAMLTMPQYLQTLYPRLLNLSQMTPQTRDVSEFYVYPDYLDQQFQKCPKSMNLG